MIKLKITKTERNAFYKKQAEKWHEDNACGGHGEPPAFPEKEKEESVLEMEITNEQFEAIKKEILKTF
jgi:hypothetical protein